MNNLGLALLSYHEMFRYISPKSKIIRQGFVERTYKSQLKRVLAMIALAVCLAVMVNWIMLELLGQKSADRAEHSLIGILLLMIYISIFTEKKDQTKAVSLFFLGLFPCYLGTVFPDIDIRLLGIGGHRNPLFHSSLSFLILLLIIKRKSNLLRTMVICYGVGLASHLWWDVLYYGDVRWLPGSRIDKLWLGVNGLLCIRPLRKTLAKT